MNNKFYYAVADGRNPGIYDTWDDCKKQIIGFKGASYKKFDNIDEAEIFIKDHLKKEEEKIDFSKIQNFAYVDGSYNQKTKVFGYGGYLEYIAKDENGKDIKKQTILLGSDDDPDTRTLRNVAGEVMGAINAITLAINYGLKELHIFYDYFGIEKWVTKEWKTTKDLTKAYVKFCDKSSKKINIHFVKVESHTGVPGNELADSIAKYAVKGKPEGKREAFIELDPNKTLEEGFTEALKDLKSLKSFVVFD